MRGHRWAPSAVFEPAHAAPEPSWIVFSLCCVPRSASELVFLSTGSPGVCAMGVSRLTIRLTTSASVSANGYSATSVECPGSAPPRSPLLQGGLKPSEDSGDSANRRVAAQVARVGYLIGSGPMSLKGSDS